MIIRRPIYFVQIEGDIKEYASQLPYTIVATYEKCINKTYVVVAAGDEDLSKEIYKVFSNLHQNIKILKKRLKKEQVEVEYSKNGIDFKINNYE